MAFDDDATRGPGALRAALRRNEDGRPRHEILWARRREGDDRRSLGNRYFLFLAIVIGERHGAARDARHRVGDGAIRHAAVGPQVPWAAAFARPLERGRKDDDLERTVAALGRR